MNYAIKYTMNILFYLNLLCLIIQQSYGDCSMLSYCNGHGVCHFGNSTCNCYEGWGGPDEIATYKAPDCSLRTCPSGMAWGAMPTSATAAHAMAECSNMGRCNRLTGDCVCMGGYSGKACERKDCPNDCSGHGRCMSMRQMARQQNSFPTSQATTYEPQIDGSAWDADMIFGCVCDSGWVVGLDGNQTQEAEYFGPDCSLRHCPSGLDPKGATIGLPMSRNDTDCAHTLGYWAKGVGKPGNDGNLCQVDCSNRGKCDYMTGTCNCFKGFYGANCGKREQDVEAKDI